MMVGPFRTVFLASDKNPTEVAEAEKGIVLVCVSEKSRVAPAPCRGGPRGCHM